MTIKRGPKPERGFTIIDNTALRDRALSFRARGILGYVLSNVDGWTTSAEEIARMGTEGRDAVRTALAELEAAGYLERHQRRTARGTFITDWVMHETPVGPGVSAGQTASDFQSSDNQSSDGQPSVHQPSDSQALKALEDQREDHQQETAAPSAPEQPSLIEADVPTATVGPQDSAADAAKELLRWWWERQDPKPAGRSAWHSGLASVRAVLEAGWSPHQVGQALKVTPPPLSVGTLEFALNNARRQAGKPTRMDSNRSVVAQMEAEFYGQHQPQRPQLRAIAGGEDAPEWTL